MLLLKTQTLTICSIGFLKHGLKIFDDAIIKDPTIIDKENTCLRAKFNDVLARSFLGICTYNSRKMIQECKG